jgi:hypothetical protein
MITPGKTQLAIGVVLAFTYTPAMGSEPNQPAIELEFLITGAPLPVSFDTGPPTKPSYAAYFTVQWRFEPTGEPNAADLLKTSAGKSFSDRQRELLDTEQGFWLESKMSETYVSGHDMPYGSATYTAYAVGQESAKKMGRALLEFLIRDEKAATRSMKKDLIERLSAMQSKLKEGMAKTNKEIEAKKSEVSIAHKKYEDAIRSSTYSLQPINLVAGEVLKTISEMDKTLDLLNIEIVGIQSKLSAIKEYSDEDDVRASSSLRLTLREMAIRQEIELVGAESRRQATMTVKRREEVLYHLFETLCDIEKEVRSLEDSVKQTEKEVKRLDRDIDHVGPGELTFYIDGGKSGKKVAIQPVLVKVQAKEFYPLYRN